MFNTKTVSKISLQRFVCSGSDIFKRLYGDHASGFSSTFSAPFTCVTSSMPRMNSYMDDLNDVRKYRQVNMEFIRSKLSRSCKKNHGTWITVINRHGYLEFIEMSGFQCNFVATSNFCI